MNLTQHKACNRRVPIMQCSWVVLQKGYNCYLIKYFSQANFHYIIYYKAHELTIISVTWPPSNRLWHCNWNSSSDKMQPSEESLITCLSDLTILNTRMHKGKHTLTHTPQTHTNTHMYIYTYIPFIAHHTCLNPHQNKRFIRPRCRFSFVTSPPPAIPVSSQIPNTLWSHEDRCVSRHSKINYNHRQATKSPC